MEKICIIIPIYNLERTLTRCLDSVINQDYRNLQILLIDDGSTDNSLNICYEYAKKDNRINVISQKNAGVSNARNTGIDYSLGEFLMFIDGDDEIANDYVYKYYSAFEEDIDIVIGGLTLIENNEKQLIYPEREGILSHNELIREVCENDSGIFGYVPNKMYRRNLIIKNNIRFNEHMHAQEDLDFALSAYYYCRKVACINNNGYFYFHQRSNRSMPIEDLIGNQVKMYDLSLNANINTCKPIYRMQNYIYSYIFNSKTKEEIIKLNRINKLDEYLSLINSSSKKISITIHLFIRKRYTLLFRYFSLRNGFAKIIHKGTD